MRRFKLELIVNDRGMPLQATVVVYDDDEPASISTKEVEPFISWAEVMNELLDSLPVQLRLL